MGAFNPRDLAGVMDSLRDEISWQRK